MTRPVLTSLSASEQAQPGLAALDFELPPALEATEPPEARGLARDEVRMMVSHRADNRVEHARFRDLGCFLRSGDVLVLNTSGTMNAALAATRADGTTLELHLSTHLPADLWVVELRLPGPRGTQPFHAIRGGEVLALPAAASATLHVPYSRDRTTTPDGPARLWIATLRLPVQLDAYLAEHGFPIRYGYVREQWPISYYQSVYVTEVGSAEMPSAGRAFTPELITDLAAHGVLVAPLLLHTGVASLEDHEPPYEEFYRVPLQTARLLNGARREGRRVIAVGTTVIRTLETATDSDRITHPGEGWTSVVVTPERGIHSVDALLTGLHEPRASHLAMLEALAGREHLRLAYAEALRAGYLWHEFGDLHLLLP
jgi:S-adenosylmethionine:tRNA ribosyltransferase-isomerase